MQDEWSIFRAALPHTLLIGPEALADDVISQNLSHLHAPIANWRPRLAAEPPFTTGTLIIRDVDTLDRTQQARLFVWMNRYADVVQVISLAELPLFPLVVAGAFLEALYYRLNVFYLLLSAGDDYPWIPGTDSFFGSQTDPTYAAMAHPVERPGCSGDADSQT